MSLHDTSDYEATREAVARKALAEVRRAIMEAPFGIVTDTLWMPDDHPNETVVDFIDAALGITPETAGAPTLACVSPIVSNAACVSPTPVSYTQDGSTLASVIAERDAVSQTLDKAIDQLDELYAERDKLRSALRAAVLPSPRSCGAMEAAVIEKIARDYSVSFAASLRSAAQANPCECGDLRKALEWYANPEIYKPHPHGPAFDRRDLSYHAIAALSASPLHCQMCEGRGEIGGFDHAEAGYRSEPCPECAASPQPAQGAPEGSKMGKPGAGQPYPNRPFNPQQPPSAAPKGVYDPSHDQQAVCECGHPYERHFDSYEEWAAVGCKYCQCSTFKSAAPKGE
jgi:hypothetical protein